MIEASSKLKCIHVHFKDGITSCALDLLVPLIYNKTGHLHYILMYVHLKGDVTNCTWEVLSTVHGVFLVGQTFGALVHTVT